MPKGAAEVTIGGLEMHESLGSLAVSCFKGPHLSGVRGFSLSRISAGFCGAAFAQRARREARAAMDRCILV